MSLHLDKLDPLPQFESEHRRVELRGEAPAIQQEPAIPTGTDLPALTRSTSLVWVVVATAIGFAIMLGFLLTNEYAKVDIRIWQSLR